MSELSAEAQRKILELTQVYIRSFPEKIAQLEASWIVLEREDFSSNSLAELNKICHKIAGSSGSYQLHEISSAAKAVEQFSLAKRWEQGKSADLELELKTSVNHLILLMKKPV